jgi:hypothetical protein
MEISQSEITKKKPEDLDGYKQNPTAIGICVVRKIVVVKNVTHF